MLVRITDSNGLDMPMDVDVDLWPEAVAVVRAGDTYRWDLGKDLWGRAIWQDWSPIIMA